MANDSIEARMEVLYNHIRQGAEIYNELFPDAKIMLVHGPGIEKKEDVSSLYICTYDDNKVGLFKRINYNSNYYFILGNYYDAGSIYVGYNSDYIGIKETHYNDQQCDSWRKVGKRVDLDNGSYVANCNMKSAESFDDMRLKMAMAEELDTYEIGKASQREIIDVLKFAQRFYSTGYGSDGRVKVK